MTSDFLDLRADRSLLRDVMVRLNLIQRNESVRVEEIAGGVSSTILKIEGESGVYCLKQALPLLKVAQLWSAPVDRVYAEIAWLQLIASVIPECVPKVLGVDTPTNSFVMSFLPPDDFPNWKSELLAGRVNLPFATSVGAMLAGIHSMSACQKEVETRFSNEDNFMALRLDPYLLETARRHPDLAVILHSLVVRTQMQKVTLVHGDISPKNILVGSSGPVFLDAECASYGDPAFDLAFCLNHLLLKSVAVRDSSTASLLNAFDVLAKAYLLGVNWEPRQDLEYRITTLLPALALARISGKSPVEYLDPSMRAVIIRIATALVAKPPTQLEELKCFWEKNFC